MGAQWLSGSVLDSRPRGCGLEPHHRHCGVSLGKVRKGGKDRELIQSSTTPDPGYHKTQDWVNPGRPVPTLLKNC